MRKAPVTRGRREALAQAAVALALLAAMAALVACQTPGSSGATASPSASSVAGVAAEARRGGGPTRDLSRDEAAGGHTLRKHVGQSDDELRERLQRERRITGASTYTDRTAAEHAVGGAIAEAQPRIQRWLERSGGHPNLVLDYDSPTPIGRTINRGEDQARPCSHAVVILKYGGSNDYDVLTSYPECR